MHTQSCRVISSLVLALTGCTLAQDATPSHAKPDVADGAMLIAGKEATPVMEDPGTQFIEQIAPGVLRYYANPAAREAALPSYAIESEPAGTGNVQRVKAERRLSSPTFATIDGKHAAIIKIAPGTSLYGTGEAAGPLLRNGRTVVAWNSDAYGYDDTATSLYKSHPWVLAVRADGSAFGVLADTTYRCEIDTAASAPDEIRFTADGPAFPVIVIEGDSPIEVVQKLTKLTGLPPLPAKWTLGYHQCRYSYFPEARVREIADGFRSRKIPCDVIWFDIDYYESFRCFTFDRGYFPDPKKLNADLLAQGFHNVWMINPGIKSREERETDVSNAANAASNAWHPIRPYADVSALEAR